MPSAEDLIEIISYSTLTPRLVSGTLMVLFEDDYETFTLWLSCIYYYIYKNFTWRPDDVYRDEPDSFIVSWLPVYHKTNTL